MNALEQFAADVAADLEAHRAPELVRRIFTIETIVALITAIIGGIRACRTPPAPTPSPTPTPNPTHDGELLAEAAHAAWNPERAEYRGWEYRQAVAKAVRQSELRGHRQRRLEAVRVTDAIFDRARESTTEALEAVAAAVPR